MKKKKLITVFASFILAFLFFVTMMLINGAKKDYFLIIKNVEGTNYIDNITIGVTKYKLSEYAKTNEEIDYIEENELLFNENDTLKIKVNDLNNIFIHFNKEKSDGKIQIEHNKTKITLNPKKKYQDYYNSTNSQTNVFIKNAKKIKNNKSIFIYLFATLLSFITFYFIINNMISIIRKCRKNEKISIIQIIILFTEYSLVNILCIIPILEVVGYLYSIIILLQMIGIVFYFRKLIKDKISIIFPLLAIIALVNITIILPPFHVPDEFAHYIKAYSMFHKEDVINKKTIQLPKKVDNSIYKYMFDIHSSDYRTSFKEYYSDANVFVKGNKKINYNFSNTYGINPFAYIPSSLVINFGIMIGLPFILTTILGRLINALIFIICGYLSLKLIPKYKKLLMLILLFPITIQQTAAINQDSITLSISFLLTSFLLSKILDNKSKVYKKDIIIIFILSTFLGLCKPGYFPICLLTFLIPSNKFKNKKQEMLIKILPVIICCGASLNKYLAAGEKSSKSMKGYITLAYAINHPLEMIELVINTFYIRGVNDLLNFQVNMFGWSTVYYHDLPATSINLVYSILLLFDNKEVKLKRIERVVYIIIGGMIFGIIYASALLSFRTTPIGGNIITGLQSRYFIPALLFIYIGLSNNLIKINIKNKNLVVLLVICITFFVSFFTILKGFYL